MGRRVYLDSLPLEETLQAYLTALEKEGTLSPGELEPGQLIEFNSRVLGAMVASWGGEPKRFPITPDDYSLLKKRLAQAAGRVI